MKIRSLRGGTLAETAVSHTREMFLLFAAERTSRAMIRGDNNAPLGNPNTPKRCHCRFVPPQHVEQRPVVHAPDADGVVFAPGEEVRRLVELHARYRSCRQNIKISRRQGKQREAR